MCFKFLTGTTLYKKPCKVNFGVTFLDKNFLADQFLACFLFHNQKRISFLTAQLIHNINCWTGEDMYSLNSQNGLKEIFQQHRMSLNSNYAFNAVTSELDLLNVTLESYQVIYALQISLLIYVCS